MSRAHQPGWHPSIRHVTTPSGRRVTLGVSASKRRGLSATYTGHSRVTGERIVLQRADDGWRVTALRDGRWEVLASGLRTLGEAADAT